MKKEIWKTIPLANEDYEASNMGRIRSLKRSSPYIMKQHFSHNGYKVITLSFNNTYKPFRVHRLVALTFIENNEAKPFINHINEDKEDNRVENLEWCTAKENSNHGKCIEKSAKAKWKSVLRFSVNGKLIKEYPSMKSTSCDGFSPSLVSFCCRGLRKTHKGFKWSYK